MFVSSAPLSIDLADNPAISNSPPIATARARILAHWSGVPVGVVDVSVRSGQVCRRDILRALLQRDRWALPREAVRRSLLHSGIGARVDVDTLWHQPEPPPTSLPKVSVIVCTRDRPDDLARCLESLARLDPAPFEVLIVDNAPSTANAHQLILARYPHFRYVCELRPGLDNARNRGIAEAQGEILAFTDDDVVVASDWVGALGRAFSSDPCVGLVTGLAEPLEQDTEAQVVFERYGGFGRGCRRIYLQAWPDRPLPWTLVGAGQLGAGANMAFRRDVFSRVGMFDPALDVGTPTLGGGDHDMFFRVLRGGFLCVYDPAVVVRHRHRRTMAELERLLYCYGHATRCLFEREQLNFPADKRSIRQLRRWWWKHWAWQRWCRAAFRPPLVPARLVLAEIKGFLRGRGAYARTRARLVKPGELIADRPSATPAPKSLKSGVGIFSIDVAQTLGAIADAADYASVEILVQWRACPVGTVRISNFGQPLSARRLADEIAHALWPRLLQPSCTDQSLAIAQCLSAFERRVRPTREIAHETPSLVSIIVTTCNRPDALRRCLESLIALHTSRPLQIIVVDNRPDFASAAPVVRDFPEVELVAETRPGSSYARNTGIAAARGDIVAMIDDDMTASPEWLERLLAPFARADVMAVTGNTLPAKLETSAERLLELYGGFGRGFETREFDSAWFHRRRWRAVPTWQIGGSGNAAFRREVFRDIAPFDVTLGAGVPTGVGEDTKLFYDILHAGYTIVYEPGAVAWHFHRVTMPELEKQLYAYSRGHVAYHLRTWQDYGDGRALVRILGELPQAFFQRSFARLRGSYAYPLRLLMLELRGTLAGPWSLWRARREAKRIAALANKTAPLAASAVAAPAPTAAVEMSS